MIKQQAQAVWREDSRTAAGRSAPARLKASIRSPPGSKVARAARRRGSSGRRMPGASPWRSRSFWENRGQPEAIRTTATVELDPTQLAITRIELETEAEVPGLAEAAFREIAEQAKKNCPVSKALAGAQIVLKSARLTSVAAGRA